MSSLKKSLSERIDEIDVDDLQYVESELCFYELVSLGLLLYGNDKSRTQFILQKLIILSQYPPSGEGLQKTTGTLPTSDILRNYANLEPQVWRLHIVEALAIIKAKKVLRKLGLPWQDIVYHYLPHVAEISVYVHPLLKALYIISERLAPNEAGKLINEINKKSQCNEDMQFYDTSYLEIFLLNWLTKHVIKIGNRQLENCDIDILVEYLKLNDMDVIKDILLGTINQNCPDNEQDTNEMLNIRHKNSDVNTKDAIVPQEIQNNCKFKHSNNNFEFTQQSAFTNSECYPISRSNAGYVLIINQRTFYKETDPKLMKLVPPMHDSIPKRKGTNVDRDKLKEIFSSFGYIPLIFEDLTHLEILHHIRETVKKSLLKDSLIICILSHGMEGVVFGCNSIPVAINEIKEILTADDIKGKPKMLIIQACQRNIGKIDTISPTSIKSFSPDGYADILLAMSSIPGTDALRHTEHGSWFVDSLYKFIKKYGESKHMLDILTAVTYDISKRKGEANQVMLPTTSSTMRKEFYLPSKA